MPLLTTFAAIGLSAAHAAAQSEWQTAECNKRTTILFAEAAATAISMNGSVRWEAGYPPTPPRGTAERTELTGTGRFVVRASIRVPDDLDTRQFETGWSPSGDFALIVTHSGLSRVVDTRSGATYRVPDLRGRALWAGEVIVAETYLGIVAIDPVTGTETPIRGTNSAFVPLFEVESKHGPSTVVATTLEDNRVFALEGTFPDWRFVAKAQLEAQPWFGARDRVGAFVTLESGDSFRSQPRTYAYLSDRIWFVGAEGAEKVPLQPLPLEPTAFGMCKERGGFRLVLFDGSQYVVKHVASAR